LAPKVEGRIVPTFTDSDGREWDVRVTHAHLRPLKRECQLDLRDVFKPDGNPVADAVADPEQVGRIAWVLCRKQAKDAGVTADEFAASMNGPAVWSAAEAIAQAVLDFFPTGDEAAEKKSGRNRPVELPDLEIWCLELGGLVGIDAGPFSLRQLFHMSAGAYDPTARLLSFVAAAAGGKSVHPDRMNPFRPTPAKSEEQKKLEHKEGMLALKTALKQFSRR
jgi:hypothetical protein